MPAESTATGFSVKTFLPASIAAFRCIGRKAGGRRQDDVVDVAGDDLLVGVPADELPIGRHGGLLAVLGEILHRILQPVLEQVADGDQPDALGRAEHVVDRAGAAAAAPDHADLDLIAAGGKRAGNAEPRRQPAADDDGRRGLEEIAPRSAGCLVSSVLMAGSSVAGGCLNFSPASATGGLTTYHGSATTRKPTNVASVCHQRLLGFWGSRRLQASIDDRRAALRSRAGSSSHDPPRTACG